MKERKIKAQANGIQQCFSLAQETISGERRRPQTGRKGFQVMHHLTPTQTTQ